MDQLRVPTVMIRVEVRMADGSDLVGRIYAPAAAAAHAGPMRADEWLDDPAPFLPFLPEGAERPVLLGKASVAVVTVPERAQAHDPDAEGALHAVEVECGGRVWHGRVAFDLPRLLDLLNRPEPFFVLRDGARDHLVHKRHVTRVSEGAEE